MHKLITIILFSFVVSIAAQAQAPAPKPAPDANQLAVTWIDRFNALDDWYLSMDGKEQGVEEVVDRMMELFADDAIAEVPPHDEEQLGPVMLVGRSQVRKWIEKIAHSEVRLNYIIKRQTEKQFEGELMVYSKPLPWGGTGVAFQIIAGYSLREDRRRFMEPGAVFLQFGADGKIKRLRLLHSEKAEIVDLG